MREGKREYKHRYAIIRDIVNKWDPIRLFPGEMAPEDEYDPEVGDVVILLNQNLSIQELGDGIYKVFEKWFGNDMANYFPMGKCYKIANEVWEAINNPK